MRVPVSVLTVPEIAPVKVRMNASKISVECFWGLVISSGGQSNGVRGKDSGYGSRGVSPGQ
jgi:hypothetical protein